MFHADDKMTPCLGRGPRLDAPRARHTAGRARSPAWVSRPQSGTWSIHARIPQKHLQNRIVAFRAPPDLKRVPATDGAGLPGWPSSCGLIPVHAIAPAPGAILGHILHESRLRHNPGAWQAGHRRLPVTCRFGDLADPGQAPGSNQIGWSAGNQVNAPGDHGSVVGRAPLKVPRRDQFILAAWREHAGRKVNVPPGNGLSVLVS